jgi:hypothetical protein
MSNRMKRAVVDLFKRGMSIEAIVGHVNACADQNKPITEQEVNDVLRERMHGEVRSKHAHRSI